MNFVTAVFYQNLGNNKNHPKERSWACCGWFNGTNQPQHPQVIDADICLIDVDGGWCILLSLIWWWILGVVLIKQ